MSREPGGWRRFGSIPRALAVAGATAVLAGCRPDAPAQTVEASLVVASAAEAWTAPPDPTPPSWQAPLLQAARGGPEVDSAATLLSRGRRLLEEGRTEEALVLLRLAGAVDEGLSDWAGILEAEALAATGALEPAETALNRLPPDLVALLGWKVRLQLHLAGGRPEEARAAARAALGTLTERSARSAAELAAARLALSLGDTADARGALARSLEAGGSDAGAAEAVRLLEAMAPSEPAAWVALFDHHIRQGNLREARRLRGRLAASRAVPAGEKARAEVEEAVALSARPEEASVVTRLLTLGREAPEPALRSRAWLAAGRIRLRQDRLGDARTNLSRAVEADPEGAFAQEALFILADLDHDAGARASARTLFQRAAALDPDSEWGGEAAMRLGGLLYQEGDDLGAAAVFEGYREAHPTGWRFQQATFWAGMAYRRMGERATAQLRFTEADAADPVGYYGMRAREVGGGALGLHGIGEGPAPDSTTARLARGGLLRVDALRRAGLVEEARTERDRLHRLLAGVPGGLHALGEAYHDSGRLVEAVRTGREARRWVGRWDLRLLRVVFPLPFAEEIGRHALREGVDPALMAALIRQESLFQPHAVSPAGATGLMQMLPRVAGDVARRVGVKAPSAPQLKDAETNLRLGSRHLADLLVRHGQRVDEVLVSYNAGPTRLARWRTFPEHADPDQFVERIPYRETREYVRVVLESVLVYQALYGTAPGVAPAAQTVEQ